MRAVLALSSRTLALRQAFARQTVRRHGHAANPGPPCTYDYVPVPQHSYKVVYNELQTKFNTYLAISTVLLAASVAAAVYNDLWAFESAWRAPRSWYERKNN